MLFKGLLVFYFIFICQALLVFMIGLNSAFKEWKDGGNGPLADTYLMCLVYAYAFFYLINGFWY